MYQEVYCRFVRQTPEGVELLGGMELPATCIAHKGDWVDVWINENVNIRGEVKRTTFYYKKRLPLPNTVDAVQVELLPL